MNNDLSAIAICVRVAGCIRKADNLLFTTGAGISAESGIPTFRGICGVYEQEETECQSNLPSTFPTVRSHPHFLRICQENNCFGIICPNVVLFGEQTPIHARMKLQAIMDRGLDPGHQHRDDQFISLYSCADLYARHSDC